MTVLRARRFAPDVGVQLERCEGLGGSGDIDVDFVFDHSVLTVVLKVVRIVLRATTLRQSTSSPIRSFFIAKSEDNWREVHFCAFKFLLMVAVCTCRFCAGDAAAQQQLQQGIGETVSPTR